MLVDKIDLTDQNMSQARRETTLLDPLIRKENINSNFNWGKSLEIQNI